MQKENSYHSYKLYLNPMCSLFEKSFTVLGPEIQPFLCQIQRDNLVRH